LAAYDILVFSQVGEGASRQAIRTNITAAAFEVGEPVCIVTNELVDGDGGPGGDDPTVIYGIAAEPAVSRSNRMAALEIEDTLRLCERPAPDKLFVARYFATDGAGTQVVPTFAAVSGVPGNLVYDGATNWTFDTGAANLNCEGVDVLDNNMTRLGDDLTLSGTGAMVLFRFV